jgi:hypothetical protein
LYGLVVGLPADIVYGAYFVVYDAVIISHKMTRVPKKGPGDSGHWVKKTALSILPEFVFPTISEIPCKLDGDKHTGIAFDTFCCGAYRLSG